MANARAVAVPPRMRHGILDNRSMFKRLYKPIALFDKLALQRINYEPFIAPFNKMVCFPIAYFYCIGKGLGQVPQISDDAFIYTAVVMETLAPNTATVLTELEARAAFIMYTRNFFSGAGIISCTDLGTANWLLEHGEGGRLYGLHIDGMDEELELLEPIQPFNAADAVRANWPNVVPWPAGSLPDMTMDEAMILMKLAAIYMKPAIRLIDYRIHLHFLIAMMKRGSVSIAFAIKFKKAIDIDLPGLDIDMVPGIMSLMFRQCADLIDAAGIRDYFEDWFQWLPPNALRLRITIIQTAGEGLATYLTINRAISKFPDFPWAKLDALIPGQLDNYQAAMQAVGSDLYYGFRRDLGPARATNFPGLGWSCKELLYKGSADVADAALNGYGGWKMPGMNISNRISFMIDQYLDRRMDQKYVPDADVDARMREITGLAKIIAARMAGLVNIGQGPVVPDRGNGNNGARERRNADRAMPALEANEAGDEPREEEGEDQQGHGGGEVAEDDDDNASSAGDPSVAGSDRGEEN
jgi:hypothetical protein